MAEQEMTTEELVACLADLTPRESRDLLAYLSGAAPDAFARGLALMHRQRAQASPSVRGGPDIGADADREYAAEQDDYTPEEQV